MCCRWVDTAALRHRLFANARHARPGFVQGTVREVVHLWRVRAGLVRPRVGPRATQLRSLSRRHAMTHAVPQGGGAGREASREPMFVAQRAGGACLLVSLTSKRGRRDTAAVEAAAQHPANGLSGGRIDIARSRIRHRPARPSGLISLRAPPYRAARSRQPLSFPVPRRSSQWVKPGNVRDAKRRNALASVRSTFRGSLPPYAA